MSLRIRRFGMFCGLAVALWLPAGAHAYSVTFDEAGDGSARVATADFSVSGSQLTIVLTNATTASDPGAGFVLTSVAFDLEGIDITGGSAVITAGSSAIGFTPDPGDDVSKEWGFGNNGQCCDAASLSVTNYVTTNTSGATQFAAGDLFNPIGLDGPSGGLVGVNWSGGFEAIESSATFTVDLSASLTQAQLDSLLKSNGVLFEWGSDIFPPSVPEPTAAGAFLAGAVVILGALRRRSV